MRNLDIVGILPAAGIGSRLSPLPSSKELVPVGIGTTLINGEVRQHPKVISHYMVEQLVAAGSRRLFITISPSKSDILQYYGNGHDFGLPIAYLVQQEPWGMPYAIDMAYPHLTNESIILFGMPDTLVAPDSIMTKLLHHQQRQKADLALALFPTDSPHLFGMVEIDDAGRVVDIVDKPAQTDLQYLWGAACWNHRFSTFLHHALPPTRPTQEIVLGDIFLAALDEMRVAALVVDDGVYLDIGSSAGWRKTLDYCQ